MRRSTSKPHPRTEPYFVEMGEPEANERCLLDQVADGTAKLEANDRIAEYVFDRMFPESRNLRFPIADSTTVFGAIEFQAQFSCEGRYFIRVMSKFERDILMLLRAFWMEVPK